MTRAAAERTVTLRRFQTGDPVSAITALLHRAYRPQMEMGLRPLAGRQDDSITLDRIMNSEAWLALIDTAPAEPHSPPTSPHSPASSTAPATARPAEGGERIVGVILFAEHEKVDFPDWFLRPDVAHFAMFAVEPDLQGLGVGRALLDKVEQRTREVGKSELALSMAEPDVKLRAYYEKRGFRLVAYWQWPYTNYRSCILSKPVR
ncbi:MAG: GNAT family N-acetyltransferase [Phycisphaerales bacterium]|nr:GNAT family N-acetyltransferase [Phycisphaerales bacterium]